MGSYSFWEKGRPISADDANREGRVLTKSPSLTTSRPLFLRFVYRADGGRSLTPCHLTGSARIEPFSGCRPCMFRKSAQDMIPLKRMFPTLAQKRLSQTKEFHDATIRHNPRSGRCYPVRCLCMADEIRVRPSQIWRKRLPGQNPQANR